eukprot:GHVQ01032141.1.p1 GENE.GHVQ01032141.1~~GHVQ01032141.1.p1  ORF type:complete len:251 (-),score=15.20 GHVQ01032141.1:436-1188(-)
MTLREFFTPRVSRELLTPVESVLKQDMMQPRIGSRRQRELLMNEGVLEWTDGQNEREFLDFQRGLQGQNMPYREFADKVMYCQFDRYFKMNRADCATAFFLTNEILNQCEDTATRSPRGEETAMCLSLSFMFRNQQGRCAREEFVVLNPHSCQAIRAITMRYDGDCVSWPRYLSGSPIFCTNNQHYAVQYEAIRCAKEYPNCRTLSYDCSDLPSLFHFQLDKCDSEEYYALHSQPCEDHRRFVRVNLRLL